MQVIVMSSVRLGHTQNNNVNKTHINTGYNQSVTGRWELQPVTLWLYPVLLNENLCKQRDSHPQIEFDFDKKHIQ